MSETPRKLGNCFYVALQMIHYATTDDDIIPLFLSRNEIDVASVDYDQLFLCHGLVRDLSGKQLIHGWIELNNWVIDYSNGNQVINDISKYYNDHSVVLKRKFGRERVLQILLSTPESLYWGDYTTDELDRIYQAYNASTYSSWDRNFLDEYANS